MKTKGDVGGVLGRSCWTARARRDESGGGVLGRAIMHSIQIGEARDVSESTLDILDMPKQQNQRMITSLKFVWHFK